MNEETQKQEPIGEQVADAAKKAVGDDKTMAAVSYLGVLFLVPLLFASKRSEYVRFHVRQGMVLFGVEVILWVIPVIGWMIMIVPVACSLFGFFKALAGEKWELPVLGRYAKNIKL